MKKPSRRAVLGAMGVGGLGLAGARLATPWFLRARPLRPVGDLSPPAQEMVRRAFADVDRAKLWDVHVHLVGMAGGGNGCWVNPVMRSHLHPVSRVQFDVYLAASGVTDAKAADRQFLERLLGLHRAANPTGKLMLLAFDYRVNADGGEVPEESAFHTPNEYPPSIPTARMPWRDWRRWRPAGPGPSSGFRTRWGSTRRIPGAVPTTSAWRPSVCAS